MSDILALTCIKDEGPWLLDWIAHHRAVGFTQFVIASHDCTDGSDSLLQALDQAGVITHLPFVPEGDKSVQWQALKLLSAHPSYKAASLALFFDVDEYLVIKEGLTLPELIANADAMPLRWHLFGNSGLRVWEDAPVTARFTHAAPDDINLPLAHFFKTLHRPAAFKGLGVHRPKGKEGTWALSSGEILPAPFASAQNRIQLFGLPCTNERAWLNHYSVRSIEEFLLKSHRGLPNHMERTVSLGYWVERNFNTLKDTRISHLETAAHRERAGLSEFEDHHAATLAHHRAHLAKLLSDEHMLRLMWQLELMQSSTPPSAAQLNAHLKRLSAVI